MARRFGGGWTALACAGLALGPAGCGAKAPPRIALVPAQGKLLSKGKPAADALVVFHPADEATDKALDGIRPRGRVQADGAFTLGSYQDDDGAPVGSYKVTVVWPEPAKSSNPEEKYSGPDRLKGKYKDPETTKLTAAVVAGTPEIQPLTLD